MSTNRASKSRRPGSWNEVSRLIVEAGGRDCKVRVRGSGHSAAGSVVAGEGYDLELSSLRKITETGKRVVVEAGRNLGADPLGVPPTHEEKEGLTYYLDSNGLALPALGGISHQTISGFLGTGSAGGSYKYDMASAIKAVRIIDGQGVSHRLKRSDADFAAVGASLGLLGVVQEVELEPEPNYGIEGYSVVEPIADSRVNVFYRKGHRGAPLHEFLARHDYARVILWPQAGVERLEIWVADRRSPVSAPDRVPYEQLGYAAQLLVSFIYRRLLVHFDKARGEIVGGVNAAFAELYEMDRSARPAQLTDERLSAAHTAVAAEFTMATLSRRRRRLRARILAALIRAFVKLSRRTAGGYKEDCFVDSWWQGLPHDNQMDDRLMSVWFTEPWVPLDSAKKAMRALDRMYQAYPWSTGKFAVELYGAPASPFWMSPAFGTAVLRIDPFVFKVPNATQRDRIFKKYWETLEPFDFRFHWGKLISDHSSSTGAKYRRSLIPKLAEFERVRKSMDPKSVFLSDYWRRHLKLS